MNYEIIEIEEKLVAGLVKRTTNENMQAVTDIGMLWQKFLSEGHISNIPSKIDNKAIGLYTDYEKDFTKPYNFVVCCEINNSEAIMPPLEVKRIQAGKYAKFSIRGHMQQAVQEAWQKIWAMPLNRNYTADFEVYHNNSSDMSDQIIDIYIAIK